jgi:hypothetical protein
MATLDQLKTRIILEIDRDDLGAGGEAEQALIDAFTDAIEFYSDQLFWFNRASGSANSVAGVASITLPSGLRIADSLACNGEGLKKVALSDIQDRSGTGVPSHWAENGGVVQLWPIPDAIYPIAFHGLSSTGVPVTGSDSNFWTIDAYKLIVARSKVALFRLFKEYDAMQSAQAEEAEALSRLLSETRRRSATPLRPIGDESWSGGGAFRFTTG